MTETRRLRSLNVNANSRQPGVLQQADQQKAGKLKQEAQQKMVSAVEDTGLDVQEFNSIARAAQNNQEPAGKIQSAAE